jgi:hypothetical protein
MQRESSTSSMLEAELKMQSEMQTSASSLSTDTDEADGLRHCASKSEEMYYVTKRLSTWQIESMNAGVMSVSFAGSTPAANIVARVSTSANRTISCTTSALKDSKIGNPTTTPAATTTMTKTTSSSFKRDHLQAYIDASVDCTRMRLSDLKFGTCRDMFLCFQRHSWTLTRHSYTAAEMSFLRRRYKAIVKKEQSWFVVILSLQNSAQTATLRCGFDLSEAYPLMPMTVKFDVIQGRLDIESLQKLLQKSAKLGFGYLTRTVDSIQAYMG